MTAAWVGGTKTPPYSIHAEKALLGACLAHPRIVARVGAIVPDGEAFFRTQHGRIYDAILETQRAGTEPGRETVSATLSSNGTLDEIGGPGYLVELLQSAASADAALGVAKQVQEKAKLRRLIDVASDMLSDAYGGNASFDDIVAGARQRLDELVPPPPRKPPPAKRRKAANAAAKKTSQAAMKKKKTSRKKPPADPGS